MRSVCAILLLICSGSVCAAPVVWTLQDVVFIDGATAFGSYTYDASTGIFSYMLWLLIFSELAFRLRISV